MRENPPRNYLAVAVDEVMPDGIEQPLERLHHRLLNGAIRLEIETLAPVHVGSGAYALPDGRMMKQPILRNGVPIMPGSSLKGMCRQLHEVLTQSASPFDRDPPRPDRSRGQDAGQLRPSRSTALFGRLGMQGRLSFDDAEPVDPVELVPVDLSVPYSPQVERGRRFYGHMPAGAQQPGRIPALAIPPGMKLTTHLHLRNVQNDELGSVLLSLGLGRFDEKSTDRFDPKIGGGKYDPLGWIRFRVTGYRLRSGVTFQSTPWTEAPQKVETFCRQAIGAVHLPPNGKSALRQLVSRLQVPAKERGGSP